MHHIINTLVTALGFLSLMQSISSAASTPATIFSGDPTIRANLRLVPNLTDAAKFKNFAPLAYARILANSNPQVPGVSTNGSSNNDLASRPAVSPVLSPPNQTGRPSQIATINGNFWQLDKNGSETLSGQPSSASFSFGSQGDVFLPAIGLDLVRVTPVCTEMGSGIWIRMGITCPIK